MTMWSPDTWRGRGSFARHWTSAGQDMDFPRAAAAGHHHGRPSLLLQHPQTAAAGRGRWRQGATGGVSSPSPQGLKDAKQGSTGGLWGDTGAGGLWGGTGGERTGVRRRWVEEERRRGLVRSKRAERGWTGGAGVGREETERMGARKLKPHLIEGGLGELPSCYANRARPLVGRAYEPQPRTAEYGRGGPVC